MKSQCPLLAHKTSPAFTLSHCPLHSQQSGSLSSSEWTQLLPASRSLCLLFPRPRVLCLDSLYVCFLLIFQSPFSEGVLQLPHLKSPTHTPHYIIVLHCSLFISFIESIRGVLPFVYLFIQKNVYSTPICARPSPPTLVWEVYSDQKQTWPHLHCGRSPMRQTVVKQIIHAILKLELWKVLCPGASRAQTR